MSLPARQQRVLDHIDEILRAGEPQLAGMYAIFTMLSAGEPVVAESLSRGRLAWRGTTVCAVVLVPVMFAMIALGVLLGGSARGATTTCGVSHSALRGAPWGGQGSCPPGRVTQAKIRVQASLNAPPVPCAAIMRAGRLAIASPARSPVPALRQGTC